MGRLFAGRRSAPHSNPGKSCRQVAASVNSLGKRGVGVDEADRGLADQDPTPENLDPLVQSADDNRYAPVLALVRFPEDRLAGCPPRRRPLQSGAVARSAQFRWVGWSIL